MDIKPFDAAEFKSKVCSSLDNQRNQASAYLSRLNLDALPSISSGELLQLLLQSYSFPPYSLLWENAFLSLNSFPSGVEGERGGVYWVCYKIPISNSSYPAKDMLGSLKPYFREQPVSVFFEDDLLCFAVFAEGIDNEKTYQNLIFVRDFALQAVDIMEEVILSALQMHNMALEELVRARHQYLILCQTSLSCLAERLGVASSSIEGMSRVAPPVSLSLTHEEQEAGGSSLRSFFYANR